MSVKGYPTVAGVQRLLVGDASRTLIAAQGANTAIVVTKLNYQVITAAAQAVDVGVSGGGVTQQILSLAASQAGTGGVNVGDGFQLPANTALTAVPAAAGPVIQFEFEYYVKVV